MLSAFFGPIFGVLGEYVLLKLGRFELKDSGQYWNEAPVAHVAVFALSVLITVKCVTGFGLTLNIFWLLVAVGIGLYWRTIADAWFDWKNP
jgi:hypothetical protein